jgi:putative membrane protein
LVSVPVLAQESPKLSDAEVAHVAVVANQIDIGYAEIAREMSENKEVLNFAETMINDHNAVISQASALVKKLGVTPKDNAVSQQLLADADATKQNLRTTSANAFDQAYIDNEVAYHKAVIAAVEGLLIPEAENAELKQLLQNVLPALRTHLEHAEMIQKQLQAK